MTTRQKCIELAKKIAKKRDEYICQKCGATRETAQIQAAHLIPVKAGTTMVCEISNIIALCAGCHKWSKDSWHEDPLNQEWFHEKFPGRYKILQNRLKEYREKHPTVKQDELEEIYERLKDTDKVF